MELFFSLSFYLKGSFFRLLCYFITLNFFNCWIKLPCHSNVFRGNYSCPWQLVNKARRVFIANTDRLCNLWQLFKCLSYATCLPLHNKIVCSYHILYISSIRIANNQATLFSFLWLEAWSISPWLCLSFVVAASLSPQNPKSLYVMVMFVCSEIGRNTKPKNPRASNSKDDVMKCKLIRIMSNVCRLILCK